MAQAQDKPPAKKISGESLEKIREDALQAHNEYRKKHRVKELVENEDLNKAAQKYAEEIASKGSLDHSTQNVYGENLAQWYPEKDGSIGRDVVNYWYQENKNYDYDTGGKSNKGMIGHFTQIVWKGSKKLGIGVAPGKDGYAYVVARYHPGQTIGKNSNKNNVLQP